MKNTKARFPNSNVEHALVADTKVTKCGKDATLAHRYPALTVANSTDRRAYRSCSKCKEA